MGRLAGVVEQVLCWTMKTNSYVVDWRGRLNPHEQNNQDEFCWKLKNWNRLENRWSGTQRSSDRSTITKKQQPMEPLLQFAPMQSSVDEGFWHRLSSLKLNKLGIDDSPIHIFGSYLYFRIYMSTLLLLS